MAIPTVDQALIQAARARLALAQGNHTRARTEAQAGLHVAQARGITYLEQELIALLGQLQSAEEQVRG